ncbi:hypothetical protein [Paenibacillus sp. sgz500958]|uniref:hypothetical protein n=1 Tax=Paenibacillus sp. sgz500958 TaxID=3242475 RepID=UPI0036D315C5
MTRRIQAYFRTEDEAEGAKTALIAYNVEGLDVWPLTDPLDQGRFNTTAMAGTAVGTTGGSGSPPAAAIVPGFTSSEVFDDRDHRAPDGEIRESSDVRDGDLKNLHYVMELKAPEEHYNEVVHILRGKHAFVEVFD